MKVLLNSLECKLEGIYNPHEDETSPLVLLLHPHPMYGGNMYNKIVVYMEKIFIKYGFTTLRFNFRGCGNSEGEFDNGKGELIDASTCLDWLQLSRPNAKSIYVAGFSFGAYIALQLMVRRIEIKKFLAIATPVNMFDISFVYPCPTDGIFIHGEKDDVCPLREAEKVIKKLIKVKNKELFFTTVPNADHYFTNHMTELNNIIDEYVKHSLESI